MTRFSLGKGMGKQIGPRSKAAKRYSHDKAGPTL